ncbi:MAG: hypothetical protein ACRD0H_05690, partial [Actinomycetes bacterium]
MSEVAAPGKGRRGGACRRVAALLGTALVTAPLLAGCGSGTDGVVLRFYTPADGAEQYAQAAAECTRAAGGAY